MHRSQAAARWRSVALLASIVGAAASAYLLVEYVTGVPGICLTGSGCDLVRASAFAYPLGVPLPLIGLLFYLGTAWLAFGTLGARRIAGLPAETTLLGAAAAGAAASLSLTAIEAFVIRALCSWCLVQAGAAVALLLAALLLLRTPPEAAPAHSSRTRQRAARALEGERSTFLRSALVGGGAAVLAVGGLLALGAGGGSPSPSAEASGLAPLSSPRLGNGPVEVVEFADFQCPACASLAPIMVNLASSNRITLVARYFPLETIHANADRSARAAAAAQQQGSFWPMSQALYARQASWRDLSGPDADAFFTGLAGDLGLDAGQWQAGYASAEVAATVDADSQAALQLGLNGTPTLFIGGHLYGGPLTEAGIRAAVDAAS